MSGLVVIREAGFKNIWKRTSKSVVWPESVRRDRDDVKEKGIVGVADQIPAVARIFQGALIDDDVSKEQVQQFLIVGPQLFQLVLDLFMRIISFSKGLLGSIELITLSTFKYSFLCFAP